METREKALSRIAKELKIHEHNISNLQSLSYVKKGYIWRPKDFSRYAEPITQEDLQQESINKDICPFCLNKINWDKLNVLINKHNKAISLLNKELMDLSKQMEVIEKK